MVGSGPHRRDGAHEATVIKRVVVVDNDPDALELEALDLALEGHEIVGTAIDGASALVLVDEFEPDVLVVDHRMPPGPSGIEVAASVRARHPDVEVIVYSNYQSSELLARSSELGVHFVPKGNLRTLRRAVTGPSAATEPGRPRRLGPSPRQLRGGP